LVQAFLKKWWVESDFKAPIDGLFRFMVFKGTFNNISVISYKIGCTRLAAASDKAYQLLAHGRWFSSGTPTSSTTKTGRHDIAEIFLKVGLNTKNLALQ
jgi:hypothetical protein